MKKTINILVVDDDANLRKTLGDILKVKGYSVVAATNGAAAIAEAQQAAVNVALIDLMLPDMSGIEVMERIKTGSPHTEAIILTGHASLTTAIEATTKGAFSYLLKPYEIEDLLLHIHHAIDRQQAQEEIRRLASFPRLNPQPVIESDTSGEVTYANPAADKLFPELRLLNGQHPLLIGLGDIYTTFRQGGQAEIVRGVEIGEASYEEHLYYVPERELVRITVLDVTERKQAAEALRKANVELSLFRKLLDKSSDAVEVLDPVTLQFLDVNETGCRDLGYSREELLSMSVYDIDPSLTRDAKKMIDEQVQKSGAARFEGIHRRKDGSTFAVEVSIGSANLDRPYGLCIVRDITERKQAEAAVLQLNEELEHKVAARTADLEHAMTEAKQANRAKSDFLVNMSHEIRTPMNGVIGMIDVLKQSGLNDRQMEMANIIHDSAFSLLALIDDILDFSRIEAGKFQIDSAPMAIASVVEGVCATLDTLAEKNTVELTLSIDPAIPAQLLGDPGRLRQLLLKLVNNAIKFSSGQRRHGRVSLRVMLIASNSAQVTLEFCVTDNGIGMDMATRARLFSAFTQADASTTRSFGGAGLGLAISGQLINIMGGEIGVQSEPGAGSTFTVRLPFALPPTQPAGGAVHIAAGGIRTYGRKNMADNIRAVPAPLSLKETRPQGGAILIVEDNEINQKVILQQLKLLGQTADIADNGREALKKWQDGGYGLLLTDLHMPEMDGYELTKTIRAAESGKPRMPIIAITANALKGEAEHCREVGMDDYLSKPVQLVTLKAMLEKWLPLAAEAGEHQTAGARRAVPLLPVPVDVNVLRALVGNDEETIRDFLRDFRSSTAKTTVELRSACAQGDAAAAGAAAHKLKSSARSVGALALGKICEDIENAGKSGDNVTLTALLPGFEQEMSNVESFLEEYSL